MRPRLILLCCISLQMVFFSRDAAAQTTSITLDHVALYVRSVDVSSHFYATLFHLDTLPHPQAALRFQWFAIGDGKALHLVEGLKDTVSIPFMTHFCFSVPSLDEFIVRLDRLGIAYYSGPDLKKGVRLREDGVRQLFIKDPDKYWVEINNAKHP